MTIILPEKVKTIIEELNKAGYEAYAVGGCVRDSILGRIPNDWDITTNAKPSEVKNIFKRTVDTGLKHGTVTVLIGKEGFEVTTYRIDGEYEDSRHPKEVLFTSNLKEDLLRRDFTINAMAYNETDGLVDIFGGMDDIESKTIRCVGNPTERFSEDALRLLRAIRFAAQLGYDIEKETYDAIKELAPTLKNISAERIQAELNKILVSDNPGMLKTAYETGLTAQFIPELDLCFETKQNNPHHCYTVGEHIIKSVEAIEPDKTLRIAMLLHDIAKPLCKKTDEEGIDHFHGHQIKSSEMAVEILRRLKYDNDTIEKTKRLVKYHDERLESGTKYMRRAINRIGEDAFPDIFKIWRADLSAQSDYMREEKLARLQANIADYEEVIKEGDCVSLKSLAVTGRDLIDAGVEPGPKLGEILNNMLTDVLEEPKHNTREYLLSNLVKMMVVFFVFTFLFACKPENPAVNNPVEDPVEEASIFVYSDTCVVTSVAKSGQSITFQNLETGLRYTLTYNNLTYFSDRYGNSLTGNQVTSGQIVDITFYREDKLLKTLEVSPDYFAYTNVEGFKFYNSATRMEYLGDKYELNDNIVVCSGKENISVLEISDTDILTIHGNDHEIFSINVDKGHGYLSLENDKYFIDGFIEIGKDIRKITEDMVLTVPEGKYSVQISKDGTSAVKEVTVGRNQEATIDLSDVEIKKNYGNVSFVTDPTDALIYMDGEKISDTSKPVRMEYGIHEIIVRADGYESLSRFISVGSAEAEVTLKLTKLADSSDSNNDNTNTSDNTSAASENNNNSTTQSGNNTYTGENTENGDNANTAGTKVYIDAPSGAELYLDGNYIGVVPTSFAKKVGTIVITLKKDGYQTRSYTINLEDVASDSRYSFSELLKLE